MNKQINNQRTVIEEEKKTPNEEKEILREGKRSEGMIGHLTKNIWMLIAVVAIVIAGGSGGIIYWKIVQGRIYIEDAMVSAPHIKLSPRQTGVLKKIFVQGGDFVDVNKQVAQVGDEILRAQIAGLVIQTKNTPGEIMNPNIAVITMINPQELRIVGRIEEDKGLKDIRIGQRAVFTVDAFGGKKFNGEVESISLTSRDNDIVFNISDKRQEKEFEIKVRYDDTNNTRFLDGMSAKLWIYK